MARGERLFPPILLLRHRVRPSMGMPCPPSMLCRSERAFRQGVAPFRKRSSASLGIQRKTRQFFRKGYRSSPACLVPCQYPYSTTMYRAEAARKMYMGWQTLTTEVTGAVDQAPLLRSVYLATENRMLYEQIPGHLRLTDSECKALGWRGCRPTHCEAPWAPRPIPQQAESQPDRHL